VSKANPQAPKVFLGLWLLIPLEFPLGPMRILAIGVHAINAVMHRPQHAHAGVQQWSATFRRHDQRLDSGLPVR
jgi:hypothetical protein